MLQNNQHSYNAKNAFCFNLQLLNTQNNRTRNIKVRKNCHRSSTTIMVIFPINLSSATMVILDQFH
jgi:hypothetical protein